MLASRHLSSSDLHADDPDFWKTRDIFGTTGLELFSSFCGWCEDGRHALYWLGDFVDWADKLPEALLLIQPHVKKLPEGGLWIYAGNHDRRCEGLRFWLGYQDGRVWIWRILTDDGPMKLAGMHGDLADPFWTPEGPETWRKRIRVAAGDEILKRGRRLETRIPWADDVIMGALGRLKRKVLPQGSRLSRQGFLDWCLTWCDMNQVDGLVTGHLHEAFIYEGVTPSGRPCRIWNTCSWLPCLHDDPDGLFIKGEIWAGVFDWGQQRLYRWTLRGLEAPRKLSEDGPWIYELVEPWDPQDRGKIMRGVSPEKFLFSPTGALV